MKRSDIPGLFREMLTGLLLFGVAGTFLALIGTLIASYSEILNEIIPAFSGRIFFVSMLALVGSLFGIYVWLENHR